MIQNMIQKPQYDSTDRLCQIIHEKKGKVKEYKEAINDYVKIKQELLHKANNARINPAKVQEKLDLKKLPTEKQTQAYIDETYATLTDKVEVAKEKINLIKKDLELLNDEIRLYEYMIKFELKEE